MKRADMSRVLMVEDDPGVRDVVKQALSMEGVRAVGVGSGEAALQRLRNSSSFDSFELMILDLTLPGIDGYTVCRELRTGAAGEANKDLPVLMLSVRDDEASVVGGLEVGADNYVTKPFSPRTLASRVRAHLRRRRWQRRWQESVEKEEPHRLSFDGLQIDLSGRRVVSQGVPVGLSSTEFDVLALLAASPGRVYSNEQIMRHLWDGHFFGDSRTASVHVFNLRKKIEPNPTNPRYIRTKIGIGYKFTYPPEISSLERN